MNQAPFLSHKQDSLKAVDPKTSAWVNANAGSGKTYVLTQRVIRLLLENTPPARLLCLTFTKAAAAEMQSRVFETLAQWTQLPDDELAEQLKEMTGKPPTKPHMIRARRLFALAVETPGGLKIQTIHAFCERILHQFTFEANVPAQFSMLDAEEGARLLADIMLSVKAQALENPETQKGQALLQMMQVCTDKSIDDGLRAMVHAHENVTRFIKQAGGTLEAGIGQLKKAVGLDENETLESLAQELISPDDPAFQGDPCLSLVSLLKQLKYTGNNRSKALLSAQTSQEKQDAWRGFFLKKNGDPLKIVLPNELAKQNPDIHEALLKEQQRLVEVSFKIKDLRLVCLTEVLLVLALEVIERFNRLKTRRGLLDFNDVIAKTVELLSASDAASWVHYKLDQGIDHILVDEAQDTNPDQWRVVSALAEEFFTGHSANEAVRTLFAVGDEKQSIYSFQGAEPAWFDRMRRAFEKKANAAQLTFTTTGLHLSFRSTQEILSAVDHVFAPEIMREGLTNTGEIITHSANRFREPGQVEIWEAEKKQPEQEPHEKNLAIDSPAATSPPVRLATKIADTIARWLKQNQRLEGTGQTIRPGDILILVRNRTGGFVRALDRALKERGIPTAGADRLDVAAHIVVEDLIALARVMLLPDDDLALACVLKSPLFDLCEEALFELAYERPGTLWQALQEKAAKSSLFFEIEQQLKAWRSRADSMPVYDFFALITEVDGGRRKFISHLGFEADDVLNVFFDRILAYEQAFTANLQGFVEWMASSRVDVKREIDMQHDEVRIMTVHGSKGLEAPVVFLVDGGTKPYNERQRANILDLNEHYPGGAIPAFLWVPEQGLFSQNAKAAAQRYRAKQENEYKRLLYVGMTRARDRLYVCGFQSAKGDMPEEGWHSVVKAALLGKSKQITDSPGIENNNGTPHWRYSSEKKLATTTNNQVQQTVPDPLKAKPDIPKWLTMPVKPVAVPERPVAPSRLFETQQEAVQNHSTGAFQSSALRRGELIHKLIESHAGTPPDMFDQAAGSSLKAIAPDISQKVHYDILREVKSVLYNKAFRPLFGESTRAEVAIAGTLTRNGKELVINGRIDRLVVRKSSVLIVDFKTNQSVPSGADDVPSVYLRQMAAYSHLIQELYPERSIQAGLLFTRSPILIKLPPEALHM